MPKKRKIKVLIIDDSLLFRETMAQRLAEDPGLEVVGTASDPFMARDLILKHEPQVLTLDVEMPRMGGIEFLKRLMPQYPLPVVVVSSADSRVFEALQAGAVEFVKKPEAGRPDRLDAMIRELKIKIKIASTARLGNQKQKKVYQPVTSSLDTRACDFDVVAIGASTGGTEAVDRILRALPSPMPPILVVQHMPSVFTQLYADRLNQTTRFHVQEAIDGTPIHEGQVFIGAGEKHLTLKKQGGRLRIESQPGEKVSGHCPSVDRLFESISRIPDLRTIAVLLTGMGQDGARGLLTLRARGAATIGQDEASSVVYGMPKVAWEMGAVAYQEPLQKIPERIVKILRQGKEEGC